MGPRVTLAHPRHATELRIPPITRAASAAPDMGTRDDRPQYVRAVRIAVEVYRRVFGRSAVPRLPDRFETVELFGPDDAEPGFIPNPRADGDAREFVRSGDPAVLARGILPHQDELVRVRVRDEWCDSRIVLCP